MNKCFLATAAFVILFTARAAVCQIQDTNVTISRNASEVTIAIDPADPRNLIAGANIDFYYSSSDGGATWSVSQLSSTYGVWGDPCLAFDAAGNGYYVHLSNPTSDFTHWIDRIVVSKSSDQGATWDDGIGVGLDDTAQQDKAWLTADMSHSPYAGNLYMSWTEFDKYGFGVKVPTDSSRIRFSRSTDQGVTWSQPVVLSDISGDCVDSDSTDEGAVPAVGPNGELYIVWCYGDKIFFTKSMDGGATFSKDTIITSQPGGWDYPIPGLQRCNGLPNLVCDHSNSPRRGTLYLLWADQRNGTDNTDVFISKTSDSGKTWSSPKKVNDDNSARHQFFPALAIDQTNGNLYSVFYDRRNTTGNATDVYLARSTDGGDSFTNTRISDSSFTPSTDNFMGDYIGITANNGRIYPIWTRQDSIDQQVVVAIIRDSASVLSVSEGRPIPQTPSLSQNYPNPFDPVTNISFSLPHTSTVTLSVYDLTGNKVATLLSGNCQPGSYTVRWNAHELPAGEYIYRLQAGAFSKTKQLTIIR
jgi:hypothetical protein